MLDSLKQRLAERVARGEKPWLEPHCSGPPHHNRRLRLKAEFKEALTGLTIKDIELGAYINEEGKEPFFADKITFTDNSFLLVLHKPGPTYNNRYVLMVDDKQHPAGFDDGQG